MTGCAEARSALHAWLDGSAKPADLAAHLERCPACREIEADLSLLVRELRSLPPIGFPDERLEQVWIRTTRASGRRRLWPWGLAAAAVLALVAVGVGLLRENAPASPSEAELRRAAAEARYALRLTAETLRRAERAAVRDVLTREVSPALRRVPIRWPAGATAQRRES
jgi:hypothetical protein